jgi:hypothetical protein
MMPRLHNFHRTAITAAAIALVLVIQLVGGSALTKAAARTPTTPATTTGPPVATAPAPTTTAHNAPAACNRASGDNVARCYATVRTTSGGPQFKAAIDAPPAGALGPADITQAYKLPSTGGGQTVAIVDAYGDSTAESDLAAFRSYYGLSPCTSANGCFRKVDQRGGTDYPADDSGWALETSLDLDAVSSACPKCNILLVQGDNANLDSLGIAVDTAVALGAKYVSNSYGVGGELPDQVDFDAHYDHPGVAVTVSTGDVGNIQSWPATNPNVVAVGGTRLTKDASTPRGWTEAAWTEGGSGCSLYEPHPDYQDRIDTTCPDHRATSDISADADPASGLAVYDTLGQGGWLQVGGTSLSSPLVAAMYALAGTPTPGSYPVTYPYDPTKAAGLFDITDGTDGDCGNVLCTAGPGWDGPTGVGTPNGVSALSQGPHGEIAGTVTDKDTGQPIAGASVSTPEGYSTHTDAAGKYELGATVGTYDVSAVAFRYPKVTQAGIQVSDGQTTRLDFALTSVPSSTVSGTVTDGSGQGWPLYATISIDGYPNGLIHTDPETGHYAVDLPQQADYTLHVTPVYAGYQAQEVQLHVGDAAVTHDVTAPVDESSCIAPGYDWNGLSTGFTNWAATTPADGWKVSGTRHGWQFDNPGDRPPPPGGDQNFAIVDSAHFGSGSQDTTLTSPSVDLTQQASPELSFDTAYYAAAHNQSASVDISVNGGKSWTTLWHRDRTNGIGQVTIPVPQAAGKANVETRFHFTGQRGWYWALDNVFIGTHACVPVTGGLVVGTVTDQATGAAVVGASVVSSADARDAGVSVATPDDAATPDGYYWLFSHRTGAVQFTAIVAGGAASTSAIDVSPGRLTRHDWALTTTGGQ